MLPDPRDRWPFVLRSTSAFTNVDEIAEALGVDRATAYRHLGVATAMLSRELRRRGRAT
jgi:predicted transcriptional regulator